jgi:hypothetical protein
LRPKHGLPRLESCHSDVPEEKRVAKLVEDRAHLEDGRTGRSVRRFKHMEKDLAKYVGIKDGEGLPPYDGRHFSRRGVFDRRW